MKTTTLLLTTLSALLPAVQAATCNFKATHRVSSTTSTTETWVRYFRDGSEHGTIKLDMDFPATGTIVSFPNGPRLIYTIDPENRCYVRSDEIATGNTGENVVTVEEKDGYEEFVCAIIGFSC
jgi:hypothetical protein